MSNLNDLFNSLDNISGDASKSSFNFKELKSKIESKLKAGDEFWNLSAIVYYTYSINGSMTEQQIDELMELGEKISSITDEDNQIQFEQKYEAWCILLGSQGSHHLINSEVKSEFETYYNRYKDKMENSLTNAAEGNTVITKKYEFTGETKEINGHVLHRIRRLSDGLIGGWIEEEENLSQEDECFVYDNAVVYDHAVVCDGAKVYDHAMVYGYAKIYNGAKVYEHATVKNGAEVFDSAEVYGNVKVSDTVRIYDDAKVYGYAKISDSAHIYGNAKVYGEAEIEGNASVYDMAQVFDSVTVSDDAEIIGELSGPYSDFDWNMFRHGGRDEALAIQKYACEHNTLVKQFPDDLKLKITSKHFSMTDDWKSFDEIITMHEIHDDFISMCPGESWESALKRAGLNGTEDDCTVNCG